MTYSHRLHLFHRVCFQLSSKWPSFFRAPVKTWKKKIRRDRLTTRSRYIFDLHSVEDPGKRTSHRLPYWMWSLVGGSVRLRKRELISRSSSDCSGWLGLDKDAKQFAAVAVVDLSKAFDCVRHDLLLQTLQSHGLGGTVLKWFHHFLTYRQQCIMLQDPPLTFNYSKGVLQASGSVLGPLLLKLTRVRRTSETGLQRNWKLPFHHLLMTSPCMLHELHRRQLTGSFQRRSPSWRRYCREDCGLVNSCEKNSCCAHPSQPAFDDFICPMHKYVWRHWP